MQMTIFKKKLSLTLCIMLIAAMALFTTGCDDKDNEESGISVQEQETDAATELGEGNNSFNFNVTDEDGKVTYFVIHTDKTIVGEALQELGLLAGDEGTFGLYVKTVNGITVDYENDGKYWAFYVNDKYAPVGVDMTEIKEGEVYSFKVE